MKTIWTQNIVPYFPFKTLQKDTVHVWRIEALRFFDQSQLLSDDLCEEEKARAMRFKFKEDQVRYVIYRAFLRRLIALYLNIKNPRDITFSYAEQGKPYLSNSNSNSTSAFPLEFNLSHSKNTGLVAFTLSDPLGVDIERMREMAAMEDIAERFFSKKESVQLKTFEHKARTQAFYRFWTCKEAFVKALGEGVFHALDRFDIELLGDHDAHVAAVDGFVDKASLWQLETFFVDHDICGAVAWQGVKKPLYFYDVSGL